MSLEPKVLNARDDVGLDEERLGIAVYVGRPSKWGNPFVIGKDGTRTEVLEKYGYMVAEQLANGKLDLNDIRAELRGKDLVCWCAPEKCHADLLLELANA